MPRTADQNATLRDASFERILTAAMTCFARDGFAATSVRTIAREAGVATGLLYAHVPSKAALVVALFERSMEQVRGTFAQALGAGRGDTLATLIRAAVKTVEQHLPFWQLSYAVRTQPDVMRQLGPEFVAWQQEIIAVLSEILDPRTDATGSPGADAVRTDALALFAQIDGLCQHYALDPLHYPVHAVAERVIRQWSDR